MTVVKKLSHAGSWREEYRQKLCSAEDVAALIKNNAIIAMAGGTSIPKGFAAALSKRAHRFAARKQGWI
ncbi:MAG: hypothetical protein PHP87_07890 [Syntrophomonas sp.]|uniref:hypothetical protein n=1 Tax=Syntrophomonas sp. TaxID=2053627 RepID=UPI0026356C51|nr:hypothetical protein [Syntrophomonas sp.]MDD4626991.1 hypothetical protein [Syntrophomonas sp.]